MTRNYGRVYFFDIPFKDTEKSFFKRSIELDEEALFQRLKKDSILHTFFENKNRVLQCVEIGIYDELADIQTYQYFIGQIKSILEEITDTSQCEYAIFDKVNRDGKLHYLKCDKNGKVYEDGCFDLISDYAEGMIRIYIRAYEEV